MWRNRLAAWGAGRWYVRGLLFPALLAAILFGAVAVTGLWWLWIVATLIAVPALVIVAPPGGDAGSAESFGAYLRRSLDSQS